MVLYMFIVILLQVTANKDEYFTNILNNLKRIATDGLRNLREPYNKNVYVFIIGMKSYFLVFIDV